MFALPAVVAGAVAAKGVAVATKATWNWRNYSPPRLRLLAYPQPEEVSAQWQSAREFNPEAVPAASSSERAEDCVFKIFVILKKTPDFNIDIVERNGAERLAFWKIWRMAQGRETVRSL